jgi:hypothetical protein
MSVTKVTNDCIVNIAASKLTGSMPAIDGSNLTGIPSPYTQNASDPAINTNPSGGLGTVWVNTASGEVFSCTDATTNENVWTNVGGGDGDVVPYNFRGSISGYMLGGYQWNTGYSGNIQKFNFASNTGQTSPANFPTNRYGGGAGRSVTEGYYFGGTSSGPELASFAKFTFGSESTSSSLGNLVRGGYNVGSHSTADYIYTTQSAENAETSNNIIERVATSSDTPSGDIGDMAAPTLGGPCTQTDTHGYTIGGYRHELPARGNESRIEKYAFASSVTSATVADVGTTVGYGAGTSSTTHGIFQHGNDVRKHQFASDSDSVAYGSFQENLGNRAGASGEDHGYFMGGNRGVSNQGSTGFGDIERVSYASNTTATDWGDLPNGRYGVAGTHY